MSPLPRPSRSDAEADAFDLAVLDSMRQTGAVVPPRLRHPFTVRYASALLLVALLAGGACATVVRLVRTQASSAAQVNTAGRQRMLSQRIALEAGLVTASTGATRDALRATMTADLTSMQAGQRALLNGDPARQLPGHPSAAVLALYRGGTQEAVDRYVATGRAFLAEPAPAADDPDVRVLQAQASGPLLPALDQIVTTYQNESEAAIARIQNEEIAVLALTLVTLVGEALLVFRPMTRRIERETQRLGDAASRHQAEAARHGFGLRLRDAVDLADTEPDLVDTVLRAVGAGGVQGHAELLLTHDGRDLVRAGAPVGSPDHACSVRSVDACPALRRGRTMEFADSGDLGACPQLRRDAAAAGDLALASTCVPVTFLGTGIGVLRTVADTGAQVDEGARDSLETIASTAGTHLGTLRAFARSRSDAERDPLTGLLNRRGLEQAVAALEAQRTPYVVVAVDLDHFKSVNDTYGHDAGDEVLVQAAATMHAALRPGDVLARHGGEEFVVILPLTGEGLQEGHGLAAGVRVAERMRSSLQAGYDPGTPSCTASLGVAGPVTSGLDAALRRADAALYRAKSEGRNRVEVAGEMLGEVPDELLEVLPGR